MSYLASNAFTATWLVTVAALGLALAFTIVVELVVAALFRVGFRGLRAVVLVNVVTNPAMNFLLLVIYGTAFGIRYYASTGYTPQWFLYAIIGALEIAVVLIEWRLLVWALGRTAGSSRKLLFMSCAMNAASVLSPFLLVLLSRLQTGS